MSREAAIMKKKCSSIFEYLEKEKDAEFERNGKTSLFYWLEDTIDEAFEMADNFCLIGDE